ncbi:MAG: alpha/beta fold hydrolase [Pseudomonadota bacterium]
MTRLLPDCAMPIVLLHGCAGSAHATFESTGWLAAIAAGGRQGLAPDLPGHGRGDVSHDAAHYADLAGLMEQALPAGPFDAVGFSLGGKLALELALRFPGRVRRLVLGGVGDNVFAPEGIAATAAAALEDPGSTSAQHPAVRTMLRHWEPERNDALAVAAVLRRPANPLFTRERLQALTAPVLIVSGADDPVGQQSAALVASLADVRREILPGVDHFTLPLQPAFRTLALGFLGLGDALT